MPIIETPFMITVCGLEELAGHADRKVSHVLSILDPDQPEPEAFGAYGEHARLELKFHDIIEETPAFQAPQPDDVRKILDFGRDILREPENVRHLLVHCHMGISRSTASMALLLAQAQPELPASDILHLFIKDGLALAPRDAVHGGDAIYLVARDVVGGIPHAERRKYPLAQEIAEASS